MFSAKWRIFKTYLCFFLKKIFFFFNPPKQLHCSGFSSSYSSKLVFYIDLHKLLCSKMSSVFNQQLKNKKAFIISIGGPPSVVYPSEIWSIV